MYTHTHTHQFTYHFMSLERGIITPQNALLLHKIAIPESTVSQNERLRGAIREKQRKLIMKKENIKRRSSKLKRSKKKGCCRANSEWAAIHTQLFFWHCIEASLSDTWKNLSLAVLFIIAGLWGDPLRHFIQHTDIFGEQHVNLDPSINPNSISKEFSWAILITVIAAIIGVIHMSITYYLLIVDNYVVDHINNEFNPPRIETTKGAPVQIQHEDY